MDKFSKPKILSMKHYLVILSVAFFAMFFLSCEKQDKLKTEAKTISFNEKEKSLAEASSNFGIVLFKKTIKSENVDNVMISPLSISLALAMTYNGADGETKTAMENALCLNGQGTEEINQSFRKISESLLDVDKQVDISIANSIWYKKGISVLADFISMNQDYYNAQVNALNFDEPESKDLINAWVAGHTNQKIPEIVDEIDPMSVMFLINAIYFKGPWKFKFEKANNHTGTFYLANGTTKQVEMMNQYAELAHFYNNLMTMVEIPYGQGNWAMDLILPNEGKSIGDVLDEMSTDNWNTWISSLGTPSGMNISLPAFKFDYKKKLNDILSDMGMAVAFDPKSADFSKICGIGDLYISKVLHKTYIEVNEEGTEAAAATSVEIAYNSAGGLCFDRPFIFVIREITTGTILFIGKLGNPER
jgi:serine protease inhibitor